jgi:hypothetical protein
MTTDTTIEVQNVVFACPDQEAGGYDPGARPLATFYAELLGLRVAREDWFVLEDENDLDGLNLAFGDGPTDSYKPPRWPDPELPQQMHLDISVHDLDGAEQRALNLGASRLLDNGAFRVYADPDGHPFCLYGAATAHPPRIERVVIDCFSPRALAGFYAALLDMPERELDTTERVVIARSDGRLPALAFQHAQFPAPRWPDPGYPQQVHLDLRVVDPDAPRMQAARELADRLGAIRLSDEGHGRIVYADPAGHPFCL